jgi:hypothetical protein
LGVRDASFSEATWKKGIGSGGGLSSVRDASVEQEDAAEFKDGLRIIEGAVITWDDNLLASLRLKNRLLQSQYAVRADLDLLIRELAVMKRYQEEFELLRPEEEVADALAAMSVLASTAPHGPVDAFEDVLNVCKVGEAPGRG